MIPFDLLVLLVLVAAASILTMMVSTVVSADGLPEHRAKCMCFSLDIPPSADVAAADPAGSPMTVELPFPGEFIDGEFQVVYETLEGSKALLPSKLSANSSSCHTVHRTKWPSSSA